MAKKAELFEHDLQQIANIARVMSHPARLAILRYLAKCKTCISGDISDEMPLSRTTVSQHLKELKSVGLIKGEVEGLKINYCLCSTCLDDIKKAFELFFDEITIDNNKLC